MEIKTTEFSFYLGSCENGVGIFAAHDIAGGTFLRLFGDKNDSDGHSLSVERDMHDVPPIFQTYCLRRGDQKIRTPIDFGKMEIGWYLNHSDSPNSFHKFYNFYAARDIKAGEEITLDYNILEEPEETKDEFYKR